MNVSLIHKGQQNGKIKLQGGGGIHGFVCTNRLTTLVGEKSDLQKNDGLGKHSSELLTA